MAKATIALLFSVGLVFVGSGLWIPAKAFVAQVLLENAWEKQLATGTAQKPWPWADTKPIASLVRESKDDTWYVMESTSGQSLAFGPGRMDPRLLPEGVTLIGGHRDTHFKSIKDIKKGEVFALTDATGTPIKYQVQEFQAMHKDEVYLENEEGQELLVLVTCYPFDAVVPGGPMRFVVLATRV